MKFVVYRDKVVKFMQNGEEDSVYFFATVTLKS